MKFLIAISLATTVAALPLATNTLQVPGVLDAANLVKRAAHEEFAGVSSKHKKGHPAFGPGSPTTEEFNSFLVPKDHKKEKKEHHHKPKNHKESETDGVSGKGIAWEVSPIPVESHHSDLSERSVNWAASPIPIKGQSPKFDNHPQGKSPLYDVEPIPISRH